MRFFLAFITYMMLNSCYSVERDCSSLRTGTFEFEAAVGAELFTTRIVRKDSIEIEYFKESIDTASIRWINDCEYILKKLNPKNRAEQKAIHIKILTTHENEYNFEFNEVGKSKRSKASARKISD